eukprot:g21322.t1
MERILLDEPTTTWQDVQAFITREIAKRDSSQVEGMVEVKEAVGTSETGLGRPGIQPIYYQVLGQGPVKAASVDRFEASALLEALDRGSDGNLAEAAAVVKSQWRVFARRMMPRGLDCSPPTTGPRSQVERVLIEAFRSFPAVHQIRQQSGLTQETLESILCQKERVSLAGKLLEVLKKGKWEIKIVALRRIRRAEEITFDYQKQLMNLRHKKTISEAAVSATDSLKSVRLTRANSLSTSASSSSDVARPMTAPSSSSASSSSRVGRQKTATSSTSASSFSKASPQKKGTHF